MKLLILAPQNFYPPTDGGKAAVFFPLIHLAKKIEVGAFFFYDGEHSQNTDEILKQNGIHTYPFAYATKDSFWKVIKNIFEMEPFKMKKYYDDRVYSEMKKIVRDFKPDCVLCHHAHMAQYAIKIKHDFGIPIILREHNIEYSLVEQYSKISRNVFQKIISFWQYHKTRKYEQKIWKQFDSIWFMSQYDMAVARKAGDNTYCVIHEGMREKHILNGAIKKEPYSLIFTGNLNIIQNRESIAWFVRYVWPMVRKLENRSKLYLYGGGEENLFKALKKTRNELENAGIIFKGFVDDIDREIIKYEIFISPTVIGGGVRMKVLNAMSLGMSIVCTKIDEQGIDSAKNGEHFLVALDAKEFAQDVLTLMNDESRRNAIGMNARSLMNDSYTWDKFENDTVGLLQSVISDLKK